MDEKLKENEMDSGLVVDLLVDALIFGLTFAAAFGIIAAIRERKESDKK